jgi:hypothetical protein
MFCAMIANGQCEYFCFAIALLLKMLSVCDYLRVFWHCFIDSNDMRIIAQRFPLGQPKYCQLMAWAASSCTPGSRTTFG